MYNTIVIFYLSVSTILTILIMSKKNRSSHASTSFKIPDFGEFLSVNSSNNIRTRAIIILTALFFFTSLILSNINNKKTVSKINNKKHNQVQTMKHVRKSTSSTHDLISNNQIKSNINISK